MTETYRIVIHLEVRGEDAHDVSWWADSPDIEGWTAGAETLSELAKVAEDGIPFYLDTEDIALTYEMDGQSPNSEGPREIVTVNSNIGEIPQSRGVSASTLVTA